MNDLTKKSKLRQTEIDGETYSITLLGTSFGLKVFEKITKAFGTALGRWGDDLAYKSALSKLATEEDDSAAYFLDEVIAAKDQSLYTDIAIAIVKNLDELSIGETVKVLLHQSYKGSQPIDFEDEFAGNYGTLIALVEFALKENFGDFFTQYLKAKGLEIPTLSKMMEKMAPSSNESNEKSRE